MSERPVDPYEKPNFPFYQEEFNGHPNRTFEELLEVADTFADTTDTILRDAESEGTLSTDDGEMWGLGVGGVLQSVEVSVPDHREGVFVSVGKLKSGRVMARQVILNWDNGYTGATFYHIGYWPTSPNLPIVRRNDNSGAPAPGIASREDALATKAHAATMAKDMGFNDQPIGLEEMQALRAYLLSE